MIAIVEHPIDLLSVFSSVAAPAAGAIDVFVGTTRDHSAGKSVRSLYYESYKPMALQMMEEIVARMKNRWNIHAVSIVHRVGEVPIGEASVAIAVSASHRPEAFDACRYAIDEVKKNIPIWKKEIYADGESWIQSPEAP